MGLRARWLPTVVLMLVLPLPCAAQGRLPRWGETRPDAAATGASVLGITHIAVPQANSRDSFWNGTLIGAAVGAALGIAFTYAVRDSDLTSADYAYGALIFGSIGAGAGLGIDAMLDRDSSAVIRSPAPATLKPRGAWKAAGIRMTVRW